MPERRTCFAECAFLLLILIAGCRPGQLPQGARPADPDTRSPESATLALKKQKYIWDIEHAAFQLEKKFGHALTAALRKRDPAALQAFCRPGFTAAVTDPSRKTRLERGYIQLQGTADGTGDVLPADASQWAGHLSDYLADFAEIDKLTCRVLDLHADDGRPESGRWSVTLFLAGVGKDPQGAFVEFVSQHRLRCYFLDDKAIEIGKIVDQWTVRSEEFRHCEHPLFEEVTTRMGLDQVDLHDNWKTTSDRVRQYHSQMAVEDFDRDGFLDLAVASANGRWRLLRSIQGNKFEEVTDDFGLPPWADEQPRSRSVLDQAFLATWIDVDNDHYPDLILGDRLYRNQQGRRFQDITDTSGLVFGYNPKGCVVADYDCDGRLDLYVLYQQPREASLEKAVGWVGDDETGRENHLWRNVGDGRFVNTTERARAGGGRRQSFAASWLHANDDHYPDLYIANDFGSNTLLLNQGNGSFRDISKPAGVSDYATSMGVATGDVTGDGRPDIYVANMFSKMGRRIIAHVAAEDYPAGVFQQIQGSCAGNRLYSSKPGQQKYLELSEDAGVNQVGWAYAPAMADFDADGWLDIYATTGFLSFRRDKPDG